MVIRVSAFLRVRVLRFRPTETTHVVEVGVRLSMRNDRVHRFLPHHLIGIDARNGSLYLSSACGAVVPDVSG